MSKEKIKEQALDLYVSTGLTQDGIAKYLGVTQKTISTWVASGEWQKLKQKFCNTPVQLAVLFEEELGRISDKVAARPDGQNIPTHEEARTRNQIIRSINMLRSRITVGPTVNVMLAFIDYIAETDPEEANAIREHADKYINCLSEKEAGAVAGLTTPRPHHPNVL